MSTRTRANKARNPGVAGTHKPAKFDRHVEHRKVRRAAHMALSQVEEPEDLALPRPHHLTEKVDPHDRQMPEVRKRRFRVWKTRAWKRRSNERAMRAAAWRNTDDDFSDLIDPEVDTSLSEYEHRIGQYS